MSWPKYRAPANLLETEPKTETMKMDSKQSKDQQLLVIQRELANPDTLPETKIALAELKVKLETGVLADSLNDEFVNDFNMWLLGRSQYNKLEVEIDEKTGLTRIPSYDTQMGFNPNGKRVPGNKNSAEVRKNVRKLTPWGTKPMTFLPEVQTYLSTLVDSRTEVMRYFTQLEMRQPSSLEELWMYYKYKVRAVGVDGWIIKTLRQMEPYDFIPKDKVPKSGSYGPGQPKIENEWGIQNPVPPPGNLYQDSIYFVNSITQLVLKTKNLSLTPSQERKNITQAEAAKIKKDLAAKFQEISTGMQQTLNELGASEEYIYKEYLRSKGLRVMEQILIASKEKETGISNNIQLNSPYIKTFKNAINNEELNYVDNRKAERNDPMNRDDFDIILGEENDVVKANIMDDDTKKEEEDEIMGEEDEIMRDEDQMGIKKSKQIKPSIKNAFGISEKDKKRFVSELKKEQEIQTDRILHVISQLDNASLKELVSKTNNLEKAFLELSKKMDNLQKPVVQQQPHRMEVEESEGEKNIILDTIEEKGEEGEAQKDAYMESVVNKMDIKIEGILTDMSSQLNESYSSLKNELLAKMNDKLSDATLQELRRIMTHVNVIDDRLEFGDEILLQDEKIRTVKEQKKKHAETIDVLGKLFTPAMGELLKYFTETLPTVNWQSPSVVDSINAARTEYYEGMKNIKNQVLAATKNSEFTAYYMANHMFLFDNILFDYLNDNSITKIATKEDVNILSQYDPGESINVSIQEIESAMQYLIHGYKNFFPSYGNDLKQDTTNRINETQLIAGTLNNDIRTHLQATLDQLGLKVGEAPHTVLDYLEDKELLIKLVNRAPIEKNTLALAMTLLSSEGNAPFSLLATQRVVEDDDLFGLAGGFMNNKTAEKIASMHNQKEFSDTANHLSALRKSEMRTKVANSIARHTVLHPSAVRAKHHEQLINSESQYGEDEKLIAAALGLNTDFLDLARIMKPHDITPSLKEDPRISQNVPKNYEHIYRQIFYKYKQKFKGSSIQY